MQFESPNMTQNLNALVFGPSGNGKTKSIETLIPIGKVVAANIEGGFLSIAESITSGAIQSVKITEYKQFGEMTKELATGGHGFDTLVVDSGTELQKLYLDMIGGDKDMPTLQDYGKLANETRRCLRFLRDLPLNLVYITLSKDEKDEQIGSVVRKPSLTGKLPEEACGYMDLVLYLRAREVEGQIERCFVTQPTERLYAKDRSGKLDRFEPVDLAAIYHKIFGPTEVAQATTKPAKGKGGKAA